MAHESVVDFVRHYMNWHIPLKKIFNQCEVGFVGPAEAMHTTGDDHPRRVVSCEACLDSVHRLIFRYVFVLPSGSGGVAAPSRKSAKPPKSAQTGVVQPTTGPPVGAFKRDLRQHFLAGASTPPLRGGE